VVDGQRLAGGTCYFSSSVLKKEDTGYTETLVTVLQTSRCHPRRFKFIFVISARSPIGDIDQTVYLLGAGCPFYHSFSN
jgi:hypothetical protein